MPKGNPRPVPNPDGRPADPRDLQKPIPVRLPKEHDDYVTSEFERTGAPRAEVIRRLVAAGVAATR